MGWLEAAHLKALRPAATASSHLRGQQAPAPPLCGVFVQDLACRLDPAERALGLDADPGSTRPAHDHRGAEGAGGSGAGGTAGPGKGQAGARALCRTCRPPGTPACRGPLTA